MNGVQGSKLECSVNYSHVSSLSFAQGPCLLALAAELCCVPPGHDENITECLVLIRAALFLRFRKIISRQP